MAPFLYNDLLGIIHYQDALSLLLSELDQSIHAQQILPILKQKGIESSLQSTH